MAAIARGSQAAAALLMVAMCCCVGFSLRTVFETKGGRTELIDYQRMADKYHAAAQKARMEVKDAFSGTPQLSFQKATNDLDDARSALNVQGESGGLDKLTNSLKLYAGALRNVGGVGQSASVHYRRQATMADSLGQADIKGFGAQLHSTGRRSHKKERKPIPFPAFVGRQVKSGAFNLMGNLLLPMQALKQE
eukprot:CAMPEP_0181290148 /NCGR_PEP_ID=MMETSP1101-20121128/1264_1 /TAXON_ID=46948 /ORGANISM="Rhodomonas abbreviata, Strain Caron Lab Isolate" /LENGTH=192 /DNA_ID=CAMNT_0023394423 /DNA_START=6 /DNA_END=584 /DNA_ORIENTATION=+